ncbi:MAG: cell division protein ZapD [Panacagrimonas sp.]
MSDNELSFFCPCGVSQSQSSGFEAQVFEQPLNERVRTFLRLEFLFLQHAHHAADETPFGARARLSALLDLLTVLGRSDLKKDILKELLDQHATLTRLSHRPGIDQSRLGQVLDEITAVVDGLQQLAQRLSANTLRDNEFLIAIMNRSTIPGGTCGFDLPAYHHWLSQGMTVVREDMDRWFADIQAYATGVELYLRLLRGSTQMSQAVARNGSYVHAPQGPCNLLRVFIPQQTQVYPEISAGAHRFTLRFMKMADVNQRCAQTNQDIAFGLQCCAL